MITLFQSKIIIEPYGLLFGNTTKQESFKSTAQLLLSLSKELYIDCFFKGLYSSLDEAILSFAKSQVSGFSICEYNFSDYEIICLLTDKPLKNKIADKCYYFVPVNYKIKDITKIIHIYI